jgi:hypothetical protein
MNKSRCFSVFDRNQSEERVQWFIERVNKSRCFSVWGRNQNDERVQCFIERMNKSRYFTVFDRNHSEERTQCFIERVNKSRWFSMWGRNQSEEKEWYFTERVYKSRCFARNSRRTIIWKSRNQINIQLASAYIQQTVRFTNRRNVHTGIGLLRYRVRNPSCKTTNLHDWIYHDGSHIWFSKDISG